MLKKRINDISNLEKSTPSKFPDAEEIYLYKVIDACIRHLFLVPDHAPKSKNDECNVLFREMNDEFYLFENYSDIMRGYLLGKQEFINIS